MLQEMLPAEAYRRLQAGEIRLIDIREPSEIAEKSIDGALLAPMAIVEKQCLSQGEGTPQDIVFFCHSGRRTTHFSSKLEKLGQRTYQLQGGLKGWEQAGLPVRHGKSLPLPMNRQIQICAGALVLLGALGSLGWSPLVWLAAFVGAGLVFAGVSGFCGMALLLARMPWNKI